MHLRLTCCKIHHYIGEQGVLKESLDGFWGDSMGVGIHASMIAMGAVDVLQVLRAQ